MRGATAGFSGAVLTGGASSRMGRDKALLLLDGRPLASIAAGALRDAGATEVFCVGGDLSALAAHGLDGVVDRYPGQGPLGGIITALAGAREPVVVVATCDLPYLTATEITTVLGSLLAGPESAVAAPLVDGRAQFLTAAYRVERALGPLTTAFEAGERAVRRAAAGLAVAHVHGLDPARLADADRPEDLPAASGH